MDELKRNNLNSNRNQPRHDVLGIQIPVCFLWIYDKKTDMPYRKTCMMDFDLNLGGVFDIIILIKSASAGFSGSGAF